MTILYQKEELYEPIPFPHEYREVNGRLTLHSLKILEETISEKADEFRRALTQVYFEAPICRMKFNWSIEIID